MKKVSLAIICLCFSMCCFCQVWTTAQLSAANTAKSVDSLTSVEKEAIMYINLARLYPQLFVKNEVENYAGPTKFGDYLKNSSYKKSLVVDLNAMVPTNALVFDGSLYLFAKCFAKESGDNGLTGHQRINCPYLKTAYSAYAECCSYGMDTGKDIAMQWLIDDKVESLGHRINCLNSKYTKIGISVHAHKTYTTCAVADFIW